MNRVTIIPKDNLVIIDQRHYNVDLSSIEVGIHAIQWYGTHGEVELWDGPGDKMINVPLANLAFVQSILDSCNNIPRSDIIELGTDGLSII